MTIHNINPNGPYKVEILRPAQPRRLPKENILEERWLHQIFLLSHRSVSWPVWKLAAGLMLATVLVAAVWRSLARVGTLAVTAIYLLFALGDWLLFWWLPRAHQSFGPIGPQQHVSNVPRLVAAGLAGLAVRLSGSVRLGLGLHLFFQVGGLAAYLWGALVEPFALEVTHQRVKSAYLPAHGTSLRLLHLSDFHVERLTRREPYVLQQVQQIKPDLIVITGDYLNLSYVDDPMARATVRQVLACLEAPLGVYATLGSPPVDPRLSTPSLFDGLGIRLLRDEVAVLSLEDGRKVSLIGMDCEHDLESDSSAFESLIRLVPEDSARVLLYHSPELMPLVRHYPIDLYLCGHTHGGQVRVPGYGAILTSSATGKQYEMGRYDEHGTTLYVSRGIGLEGLSAPRMRMLCRPEIILFDLSGDN